MAMAEQAVILAAGRGTRLQKPDPSVVLDPATEAIVQQGIKALVPIGGRPFLDYSIERLMKAGIRQVCVIVAPDATALERYVAALPERFPGLETQAVIQTEPLGTAHALRFARPVTGIYDFLMINSDNLYPVSALKALADAPTGACYAVGFDEDTLVRSSNIDASRVSKLGVLVPRRENPELLERVVEKPEDPSQYAVDGKLWITMNSWRFSAAIYPFCEAVARSARGEYELTSAVQDLSESGIPVRIVRCQEGVLDLTSRADIHRLEGILGKSDQ